MGSLRRGHRLHSIGGLDDLDSFRLSRLQSGGGNVINNELCRAENDFLDAIRRGDNETVRLYKSDPTKNLSLVQNWDFVKKCAKSTTSTGNIVILKDVIDVLIEASVKPLEIAEIFALEAVSAKRVELTIGLLNHWSVVRDVRSPTHLDVINTSIYYAANRKLRHSETLSLVESIIYYATIDGQTIVLKEVCLWHDEHVDVVGASVKLNADCIIHATLEDDKPTLQILYSYGYRLGPDTDRRINKDYLKRIKLFRARASPVYNIVAFEESRDIENHDPLKKCFEYARMARSYASKIQDFTKEYMDIAQKCEDFSKGLLDRCTTKHEVQTLLQTRSYRGHTNANFNVAILDGHKEFVAHEKFQQLLHKKWGQRDRLQWKHTPSYNIFWSEMNFFVKLGHVLKQIFAFPFLPLVALSTTIFSTCCESCWPCGWFIRQSQIPVNRFLYWEMSKLLFYAIILITLVDDADVAWYDLLAAFWIISYILENPRTILRLLKYSGLQDGRRKVLKRWLTFRNIYILATDLMFLIALILRCYAYFNNQCRGGCPYEGNEIAFIAAAIWSIAALLTFLRSIQGGLMWRQTGPIIISMSYMILDVAVFLFIFVIVYIAFTLSMVYIYTVYSDERTEYFNNHKMAFKLFFWAMIRTGNPQFADIRMENKSLFYNTSCLETVINKHMTEGVVHPNEVKLCSSADGYDIEEGMPYIAGNTLWAVYQFTVVIVLLSVLRARMVNTYHRIFKEADVQWKYFRACIWWKYLDQDSILPPPYTVFFFLFKGIKMSLTFLTDILRNYKESTNSAANGGVESPLQRQRREQEQMIDMDKKEFDKRYTHLMIMLINTPDSKGLSS